MCSFHCFTSRCLATRHSLVGGCLVARHPLVGGCLVARSNYPERLLEIVDEMCHYQLVLLFSFSTSSLIV